MFFRKMTVYRLEHEDSLLGPYRHANEVLHKSDSVIEKMIDEHSFDTFKWPVPKEDGTKIKDHQLNYSCGFDSLEKLINWFDNYLPYLVEHGFKIRQFKINKSFTVLGNIQLLFDRQKATLIGEIIL